VSDKRCFFDPKRTCDLTCKAAFEVDDPLDNVDCHFIWLAFHLGEGVIELKRVVEGLGGAFGGGMTGGFPFGESGGPGPHGKKKDLPEN
jgi:hypothetical protein